MRKIFGTLVSVILASSLVVAKTAPVAKKAVSRVPQTSPMQATVYDPSFPTEELEHQGVQIRPQPQSWPDQLPTREVRDRVFNQSGVTPYLQRMDAFEKDILYARARNYTVDRLSKFYPSIPANVLQQLHREIARQGQR